MHGVRGKDGGGMKAKGKGERGNGKVRSGRLTAEEREGMERDLRLALNAFQRENYANDFRRGWRWAYRTGLDGGKVTQNWSQDAARRYGQEAGLSARERRAEELKSSKVEGIGQMDVVGCRGFGRCRSLTKAEEQPCCGCQEHEPDGEGAE